MEGSLVSWLMPMYNDGIRVKRAIDSMLAQTYQNFEIVIVLDPSNEETVSVCKEYKKQDSRVRVIYNEERLGIPESLNVGLKHCRGKYIARMDADDYSYPERLEKQVRYMEEHSDVDLLGGNVRCVREESKESYIRYPQIPSSEEIRTRLLFRNCLIHPSIMFRADIPEFQYPCIVAEDYGIYAELLSKVKMAVLPDVILDYMIRKESAGNANIDLNIIYSGKISREALARELGINSSEYPDNLFGMRESLEVKDAEEFLNNHLKLARTVIEANARIKRFEPDTLIKTLEEEWNLSLWMLRPEYNLSVLKQPITGMTSEKIQAALEALNGELPSEMVVYGTGKFCQRIIEKRGQGFLDKVVCFCDSNLEKQGTEYFGKKTISPDQLEEISYDAIAVVSERFEVEIKEALLKRGISENKIIIL